MATQIRVRRWIVDNNFRVAATFETIDKAQDYVRKNNKRLGKNIYDIDRASLPRAYYACSNYESADGNWGYGWCLDGKYKTLSKAVAKAVRTANSVKIIGQVKIEVFVFQAECGLTGLTDRDGEIIRYQQTNCLRQIQQESARWYH